VTAPDEPAIDLGYTFHVPAVDPGCGYSGLRIARLHVPVISRLSLVDGGFYGERTWLPGRPVDLAILAGRITPTGSTLAGTCSSSPGSALRSNTGRRQCGHREKKPSSW
jgi:hypothetical protein